MAYTSATLVEAELRASEVFSGSTIPTLTQVTTWIEEESALIDQKAGSISAATTYTEFVDYEGSDIILLKHSPIITVSSVAYNTNPLGSSLGEAWVTKTADTDYTLYEGKGKILLLPLNFSPADGPKRFRIVYSAGYSTTPYPVQALATKKVALRVLDTLLSSNVNEANDGGEVSVGSIRIVEPGNYGGRSLLQLKDTVRQLENEVAVGTGVYRYTW